MTAAPSAFATDAIGVPVPGRPVTADPELASALSAALADGDAGHLSGREITPMFNILPIYSCLFLAVDRVTPEQARPRIVHGAHDLRFVSPVRVGATLSASATVVGVRPVGAGAAVSVRILVTDDRGAVTSEQWATALVRGQAFEGNVGTSAPEFARSAETVQTAEPAEPPERTVETPLQAELPRLFAGLSGDRHSIHLVDAAARSAGFDGVIMHGLCTLGLVSSAVVEAVCPGRPSNLVRLAGRFQAPAYPRGTLRTTVRQLTSARHGVSATAGGFVVIGQAAAEVIG